MAAFRIGTTSFIIPADIGPNVSYLAGKVDDIELLLFEVDDDLNPLPAVGVVDQLLRTALENGLTFTVYLPLELNLGGPDLIGDQALGKAIAAVDRMQPVDPAAHILHLQPDGTAGWTDRCRKRLHRLSQQAGGADRLAVENNGGEDPGRSLAQAVPFSFCIDVGHLWRDAVDPLPYLRTHLSRASVVHVHGVAERDHRSLTNVPEQDLWSVISLLVKSDFQGVVTIEVFDKLDFLSSLELLEATVSEDDQT